MASVFIYLYQYPDSTINPFPPPTQAEVSILPSLTPSQVALPEIWTPLPVTEEAEQSSDQESLPEATAPEKEAATKTPVLILPTKAAALSGKTTVTQQKSIGILLPTIDPLKPTGGSRPDSEIITITAPIGVFNNTWQNIQSIPSFSWSTSKSVQEIDHFLLYFGTKQNGRLTEKTAKMNYNRPAVPSGIYYFRIIAIAKSGKTIGSPSTFLFKYDETRPTNPSSFSTTSNADNGLPYFTWTESVDAHSGMFGGLAGYSIYQGTVNKCGKPTAFTTVPHWTPVTPLSKGSTEYFCIRAMDAIGNESNWVGPVPFTYAN
jgi:hypothetical protein